VADRDTQAFYFRPAARLQRFLGRELIADANLAIIEFVKTAYDAGATDVHILFGLREDPTSLIVADNGVGMDEESFEDNWMHPGFSSKADGAPQPTGPSNAARRRQNQRVPVGEKGIGRLAAGRLGERLDVFTRASSSAPWLHVAFDWSEFESMSKPLDEVPIEYDFDTEPEDPPFKSGTLLLIEDLSIIWEEKLRGRPVRGRKTTRLGRLKQDLQFLIRPMKALNQDFTILLDSDMIRDTDDIGTITPEDAISSADYTYSFDFALTRRGAFTIRRRISRSPDLSQLVGEPESESFGTERITAQIAKEEGRPERLLCGSFSGVFLYNPPPAAKRAREINESPVGVLLYRDGMLVEPYGMDDNDWLGVRARKAQRQGHAAIQPDTFSGHVLIARDDNPKLRDMTNRLGLLETLESENFFDHVRAEFRHFEALLYEEVLEPRWEANTRKEASRRAGESQTRANILLRSLAHSLRQPLMGLGWELLTIEDLEARSDLPKDVAETLSGVRKRSEGHIRQAEEVVDEFLELDKKVYEFEDVSVDYLIETAIAQVSRLARSRGAKITSPVIPSVSVLVPPALVVQALASLLTNGIEAPRPEGRTPTVMVHSNMQDGDVLLEIADNGVGIDGATPDTALSAIQSTKGRPAVGLQNAEVAITAAGGRIHLRQTSAEGTTVEVELPTRLAGLRT
jgi:signal transduction histidine kinase